MTKETQQVDFDQLSIPKMPHVTTEEILRLRDHAIRIEKELLELKAKAAKLDLGEVLDRLAEYISKNDITRENAPVGISIFTSGSMAIRLSLSDALLSVKDAADAAKKIDEFLRLRAFELNAKPFREGEPVIAVKDIA